ncbi:MAG: hypothetical protein LBE56_14245 [Tannerella sp.]|jgi:nitrogen fixation-related uncharacterized protein|nr:hypothetical protein [Tannerella sp.]
MKSLILIIGALFIVFNTLIGIMLSDYSTLNFLLADLSIVLTAVMIYWVVNSKMAAGFTIAASTLLIFTGIIRLLCVALAPSGWENNLYFIAAISILLFELAFVAVLWFIDSKQSN